VDDVVQQQRPLRRDAQVNRQRIIDAAREVFAVRGLSATLDDVAQHAGVGIGTVYRRFPCKEALVQVALEQQLKEHVRVAEAALREQTGWDGLVLFLSGAAEMHAADRGLRDIALGTSFGARHHDQISARVVPLMRQLVDRAQREGSLRPDVTVEDIPLVLMMVSEVACHSGTTRPDAFRRYLRLIIDGMRRSPDNGPLGSCLTTEDLDALARDWLPSTDPRR
jgi:AcrR family transcriptional regulator